MTALSNQVMGVRASGGGRPAQPGFSIRVFRWASYGSALLVLERFLPASSVR